MILDPQRQWQNDSTSKACVGFPGAQMVKNPPAMRETWV